MCWPPLRFNRFYLKLGRPILKTSQDSKNIKKQDPSEVSWLHNRFDLPKSETCPILSSPWNDQEIPPEVRPIDFRTHGLPGWTWSQFLHGWPWLFAPNIHRLTPARHSHDTSCCLKPGGFKKAMHPNHLEFQVRVFSTSNHHSHPNPISCPFAFQWQLQVSGSGLRNWSVNNSLAPRDCTCTPFPCLPVQDDQRKVICSWGLYSLDAVQPWNVVAMPFSNVAVWISLKSSV